MRNKEKTSTRRHSVASDSSPSKSSPNLKSAIRRGSDSVTHSASKARSNTANLNVMKTVLGKSSAAPGVGAAGSKKSAGTVPPNRSDSELRFAPQVITSVREYCDYEPPNFLLMSPDTPLYDPVNFKLDPKGQVLRENASNHSILTQKVRLDSLNISKYHLNGYITCASLSMDQNCYVRVSSDGWTTFQESQAIEVASNETCKTFSFDYLLPISREKYIGRLSRKRSSIDIIDLSSDENDDDCDGQNGKSLSKKKSHLSLLGQINNSDTSFTTDSATSFHSLAQTSSSRGSPVNLNGSLISLHSSTNIKNATTDTNLHTGGLHCNANSLMSLEDSFKKVKKNEVPFRLGVAIVMRDQNNLFYDMNCGETFTLECNL